MQLNYSSSSAPTTSTTTLTTRASPARLHRPAAPSHRRRRDPGPVGAAPTTASSSSASTPRATVRPRHRLLLVLLRHRRRRAHVQRRARRANHRAAARHLATSSSTRTPATSPSLVRATPAGRHSRRSASDAARSSPSIPATARCSRLVLPVLRPQRRSPTTTRRSPPTWDLLDADPEKPLLGRGYRERYFPGSTFKVVTARPAASGMSRPSAALPARAGYDRPGHDRPPCATSVGRRAGAPVRDPARVVQHRVRRDGHRPRRPDDGRRRRGVRVQSRPPLDLPAPRESFFPDGDVLEQEPPGSPSPPSVSTTVPATPLQMALVAGRHRQRRLIMKPHVIAESRDRTARSSTASTPRRGAGRRRPRRRRPCASDDRRRRERHRDPPCDRRLQVGGKTGTAQIGTAEPRRTPGSSASPGRRAPPTIAVAVIVEAQPGVSDRPAVGSRPRSPAVMEAALRSLTARRRPGAVQRPSRLADRRQPNVGV